MTNKDFKEAFLKESESIDIRQSERLKQTPIQQSASDFSRAKTNKTRSFRKFFMPLTAACCLIIALSLFIINPFGTSDGYLTAYAIDINPSISIITDENDEVIKICSLNEDADAVLSDDEFDDIIGERFETAVGKIIKVVCENGVFNGYQDTIRIYALNDNRKIMDDKLNRFGNIVEKELERYGHGDIGLEKHEMTPNDFQEKMGIEGDFKRLDDMRNDIEKRDKYKGNPPPDGDVPPPKPEGDVPPPK